MKEINAIVTISFRDLTKFLRDKTRILFSLIFPFLFIGILGDSFASNLEGLPYDYMTFVFTGVLAQTLFQSTASGVISLIADRQNDFAQELFISPISRYSIIIGKIIGETMVAMVQAFAVITFGLIVGVDFTLTQIISLIPISIVICLFGGAFGVLVLSNLKEERTANQIFPFLIFPQYFLAGVFNPIAELSLPLFILSRIAPLTYAVDLFRSVYFDGDPAKEFVTLFPSFLSIGVVAILTVVFIIIGTQFFVRNEKNR